MHDRRVGEERNEIDQPGGRCCRTVDCRDGRNEFQRSLEQVAFIAPSGKQEATCVVRMLVCAARDQVNCSEADALGAIPGLRL